MSTWLFWRQNPSTLDPELLLELEDCGRVAVVSQNEHFPGPTQIAGCELERISLPSLDASDSHVLLAELADGGFSGLLIDAQGGRSARSVGTDASLREALRAGAHRDGLRGVYLSPAALLFEPSVSVSLDATSRAALPRTARLLLQGVPAPRPSAFPEPLRRLRNVEVMVLLRENGRARLWRSARGRSILAALTTATRVARERWAEREQAMGGPLDEKLARLDVEVALLEEDGTIGDRNAAFVEHIFDDEHGVAYETRVAWRYMLPDATEEAGQASAVRAYQQLFENNALPEDSLRRADLRFYRLVVVPLGTSTGRPPRAPVLDMLDTLEGVEPR